MTDLEGNQGRNNTYIIGVQRKTIKSGTELKFVTVKRTISGCKDLNLPIKNYHHCNLTLNNNQLMPHFHKATK